MRPAALVRKGVSGLAALMAAPAALLLAPGRAEAILVYNIFDSGPNVTLQASGSINPAGSSLSGPVDCSSSGKVDSNNAILCIGQSLSNYYAITGLTSFLPQDVFLTTASITGKLFLLDGIASRIYIDPTYTDNDPSSSSAIFNGTSLATLGFTTPGLIASWQLDSVSGDDGLIELRVGAPAEVPGPLPLFGAAAAFGWSRTLRRRIRGASTTTV